MRFRTTLILALVCAGLGAYLYFVEFERAEEEGKKKTLFTFEANDVTGVTLTYPDREIALKRADGTWRLAAPIEAAADDTAVDNLVRAIADCEVKKSLDDTPDDLAPFGLDKPKVTVKVALKDRELPAVRVGKTSPVGYSTYIQRADEPKIYLTTSAFQSGMDKQVKDLRSKTIVDFKDDDVRRITVAKGGTTLALVKTEDKWSIEQPAAYAADESAVRGFLSSLRSMRAKDFPSEDDKDLPAFGLDAPRTSVVLAVGADGTNTQILFGKEAEDKSVYVKVGNRPTVFTIGDWAYRDVDKGLNDFRDKSLLVAAADDVRGLELVHDDGERVVLSRDEAGKWKIEGQEGAPEDMSVDRFRDDLLALKGYEIVADAPADLEQFGLAKPALVVTARGKDGAVLGTVRFGSHTPAPPATEYTAQREGQNAVLHIRDYQFKRIDKRAPDFLPKPTPTATPAAEAGGTPPPAAEAAPQ